MIYLDQIQKNLDKIKEELLNKSSINRKLSKCHVTETKMECDESFCTTQLMIDDKNLLQKWTFMSDENITSEQNLSPDKIIKGDNDTDSLVFGEINALVEENKEMLLIHELQKMEIEKLLQENSVIRDHNNSIISSNEKNTKYLCDIIEELQIKIKDLTLQLEKYQINTLDKNEKSILQLIDIFKDIPKQFQKQDSKKKSQSLPIPVKKIKYQISNSNPKVKVICKVKPDDNNCLSFPSKDMVNLPAFRKYSEGLDIQFTNIYKDEASQIDMFEEICPVLPSCFADCNVCVLCFGQSGSGKSHTMIGSDNDQGLMTLSMKELIKINDNYTKNIYRFHLSIVEMSNDLMSDLISMKENKNFLTVKRANNWRNFSLRVKKNDISETVISKMDEFNYYMKESLSRLKESLNERQGNRLASHYIVMVRITGITDGKKPLSNQGSLIMCDMACSEFEYSGTSKDDVDSKFIEKSLARLDFMFQNVFRRLPSIPFRDSRLRRISNQPGKRKSHCVLIATVSGSLEDLDDTYRTLNIAKQFEIFSQHNTRPKNSVVVEA